MTHRIHMTWTEDARHRRYYGWRCDCGKERLAVHLTQANADAESRRHEKDHKEQPDEREGNARSRRGPRPTPPFRPDPADEVRGGYYVSVINGRRFVLALGPFDHHADAKANVDRVCQYVNDHYLWSWFYKFGTCRVIDPADRAPGKLNEELG